MRTINSSGNMIVCLSTNVQPSWWFCVFRICCDFITPTGLSTGQSVSKRVREHPHTINPFRTRVINEFTTEISRLTEITCER